MLIIFLILLWLFIIISNNYELFSNETNHKKEINDIADNIVNKLESNNDNLNIKKETDNSNKNLLKLYNISENKIINIEIQIKLLENKLNNLISKFNSSKLDDNEKKKIAKETKETFSKNISKSAGLLSGLSSKESKNMLDDHYSKTLTERDAKNTILKQIAPVISDIFNENINKSTKLDSLFKNIPSTEAEELKSNYIKQNKIKCDCNNPQGPNKLKLGNILIETADKKIYKNMNDKIIKKCGNNSECRRKQLNLARIEAGEYLKNLSDIMGCKITKKKGLFPYNIETKT